MISPSAGVAMLALAEQVGKDLLQRLQVGLDGGQLIRQVDPQGNILFAQLGDHAGHGIIDDRVQVHHHRIEAHLPAIQGGDLDQLFQQAAHALGGGLDPLEEFALHGAQQTDRFTQQQVGVADDGGHRLAQLLGDGDDHLAIVGGGVVAAWAACACSSKHFLVGLDQGLAQVSHFF